MKFDKITVFNNIVDVINNKPYKSFVPMFLNKIIVGEYKTSSGYGVVRVWKNNQLFGVGQISQNNTLGALDYQIHDTIFKIEYVYVYDYDSDSDADSLELNPKYKDAKKFINLMIQIAEKKSNDLLFDKMIMDTHMSLRLFDRYYDNEGFTLTGKVASDNISWVEMMRINTNKNQHNL
jgi:hypothetical protein